MKPDKKKVVLKHKECLPVWPSHAEKAFFHATLVEAGGLMCLKSMVRRQRPE